MRYLGNMFISVTVDVVNKGQLTGNFPETSLIGQSRTRDQRESTARNKFQYGYMMFLS